MAFSLMRVWPLVGRAQVGDDFWPSHDPVKTQFGWHIIKVEDKRIKPTPTFEQVKPQLENYVAHRAQAQLVDNLRKTATIERLDKPAAPAKK